MNRKTKIQIVILIILIDLLASIYLIVYQPEWLFSKISQRLNTTNTLTKVNDYSNNTNITSGENLFNEKTFSENNNFSSYVHMGKVIDKNNKYLIINDENNNQIKINLDNTTKIYQLDNIDDTNPKLISTDMINPDDYLQITYKKTEDNDQNKYITYAILVIKQ